MSGAGRMILYAYSYVGQRQILEPGPFGLVLMCVDIYAFPGAVTNLYQSVAQTWRKNMALTIIQFDVIFLPRVLNIQKSFPKHAAGDN
jgi:hypothetical protein